MINTLRFGTYSPVAFLVALPMTLLLSHSVHAENSASASQTELKTHHAQPQPDVKAWALMEMQSGWVIAGANRNDALPPASITKLMTNYVAFDALRREQINLSDPVSISEAAWRAEGSRMFADVNSTVELKHLLKSTIIQSGNDAAIALAEHIAGNESGFVHRMNQSAEALGLSASLFENSSGLPSPNHRMSAVDIAKLSAAIIREFPSYFAWYSEKEYAHNGITQYNRNKLLWREATVDGFKTGHTQEAGYCLVGTALRNGQRWIAVVLGAKDAAQRESDVLELLNYGFAAFQSVAVLDQQGGVAEVPVFQGIADALRLKTASPAYVVVPKGREKDLKIDLQVNPYYLAPIGIEDSMGVAQVVLDGEVIAHVPLVSMSEIAEAGWWKRTVDSLKLRAQEFLYNSE